VVVCSDTALYLPFPDSSLCICGRLQGAGRGAILRAAIKILPKLQKLFSPSPSPCSIMPPKVTPPQVQEPAMLASAMRRHQPEDNVCISSGAAHEASAFSFFWGFLIYKSRGKKTLTGITCTMQPSQLIFLKTPL